MYALSCHPANNVKVLERNSVIDTKFVCEIHKDEMYLKKNNVLKVLSEEVFVCSYTASKIKLQLN